MNITELFNNTNNTFNNNTLSQPPRSLTHILSEFLPIIVPCIYACVCIFGFVGNALVVLVFGSDSQMRDSTNALIINLAICDLMFIIFCVPFTAVSFAMNIWPFSSAWCSIVSYLQHVSAYGSVWTLVFLTIDRFLAVSQPVTSRRLRTLKNTIYLCVAQWFVLCALNVPILHLYKVVEFEFRNHTYQSCVYEDLLTKQVPYWQIRMYHLTFVCGAFIVPLSITAALNVWIYHKLASNPFWKKKPNSDQDSIGTRKTTKTWQSRSFDVVNEEERELMEKTMAAMEQRRKAEARSWQAKRRVLRMIVTVTVVFAVCWLPLTIVFVAKVINDPAYKEPDYWVLVVVASQVLAYMNSAINPILYGITSSNFRRGCATLANACFGWLGRNRERNQPYSCTTPAGGRGQAKTPNMLHTTAVENTEIFGLTTPDLGARLQNWLFAKKSENLLEVPPRNNHNGKPPSQSYRRNSANNNGAVLNNYDFSFNTCSPNGGVPLEHISESREDQELHRVEEEMPNCVAAAQPVDNSNDEDGDCTDVEQEVLV